MNQPPQPERRAVTILRRADQACAAVLVAVSLAVIAVFWVREWARHDDRIDVERASSRFIEFQIDVNSAPWTEFALLPNVGETLAKRIVASREAEGSFLSHEDLLRVRGIGPKTLERMRPYLLPVAQGQGSAPLR